MAEQLILEIKRPLVEIGYHPESLEAEVGDRLAACNLAMRRLAMHVMDLHRQIGSPCPAVVTNVAESDFSRDG